MVTVGAPGARSDEGVGASDVFRPTNLMERVSLQIEQHPNELTKNQAVERAGGRKQSALHALGLLCSEGYLTSQRGRSGHPVYTSVKSYREQDDPQSDHYVEDGNVFPPQ
jgi:hypothetical protein